MFAIPVPAALEFTVLVAAKLLLGFKGNEWAWQARQWQSAQQFKVVQGTWMNWGTIVVIIVVILLVMLTRTPDTPDVPAS